MFPNLYRVLTTYGSHCGLVELSIPLEISYCWFEKCKLELECTKNDENSFKKLMIGDLF